MMTDWYLTKSNGERQGPLDEATLIDMARRGVFNPQGSFVWREGLES